MDRASTAGRGEITDPVDWLDAEEALERSGLAFLADPWTLRLDDGRMLRVRIVEVSRAGITVKRDDGGAIDAPQLTFRLPFPAPDELLPGDQSDHTDPFGPTPPDDRKRDVG